MSTDLDREDMVTEDMDGPTDIQGEEGEESEQHSEGNSQSDAEEDDEVISEVIVKVEKDDLSDEGQKDILTNSNATGEIQCRTRQHNCGLSMNLAIQMLTYYEDYLSSMVKDWHPKEGEVYVFDLKKVKKEWKDDGYDWKNNGSTVQPKSNPTLKKVFFIVRSEASYDGDRKFSKVVYSLVDRPYVILVHYTGDSSIVMAVSNRKKRAQKQQLQIKKKRKEDEDVSVRGLTIEETVETLENYEEHLSMSRAIRPKGGEIYIFDRNMIGEDWKCDGYIWRNSGTRYMPSKNPVMRKNFYFIRTHSSGEKGIRDFKKSASYLLKRPNIVLVHYVGDETVFTPRKHGNRKKGDVEFLRTCPSVIEAIKSVVVEENPIETYQRLVNSGGERPRDVKQVQSLKERLTRSTRHPRKKKYMTEQELKHVEHAANLVTMQICNNPDNESMDGCMDAIDTSKITDENMQPLLLEPVDSHPKIRELQLKVLQQHRRNMKLQEEKLCLEIEKLERTKKINQANQEFVQEVDQQFGEENQHISDGHVIHYVDESKAAGFVTSGLEDDQHVIYVNSESDLMELTRGMYEGGDGEPQYVYIQDNGSESMQQLYTQQIVDANVE